MGRLVIILVLVLLLQASGAAAECSCLNGGSCNPEGHKRSCNCQPGFVGSNCKTRADAAGEEAVRVPLTSEYSYLFFSPRDRNYFKLVIEICRLQNTSAKNSVLYLQTEDEAGGWNENPSFLETTEIVLEDSNCTLLSTLYMSTGLNPDGTYRKVLIGLKLAQEELEASHMHQLLSLERGEDRMQLEHQAKAGKETQQVSVRVRYQTYSSRNDQGQNVVAVSGSILLLTFVLLLILHTRKTEAASRGRFLALPRLSLAFHRSYSFRFQAARKPPIQHNSLEMLDIFMPAIQLRADCLGLESEQQAFRQEGCSICLVDFQEEERVRVTPCRHVFHQECIDAWCRSRLSCPICRRRLDFPRCLAEAE